MLLVQMPRGTGKTEVVLRWLAADKTRRAVVATAQQAQNMQVKLIDMGVDPARAVQVVLAHRAKEQLAGHTGLVAVDELDAVLGVLLGHQVTLGTFSA